MTASASEEARFLVGAAHTLAISSFAGFLDLCPSLQGDDQAIAAWDFFATVAGVGVAFMTIVDTVPEPEQEALCHAVANELDSWRPHGYAALVDFTNAVRRFEARGVETPLALGSWVFLNVTDGQEPTRQDAEGLQALGYLLLHSFLHWWRERRSA